MLALSTMVLAATAQTTITATYAAAGGFVDAYAPAVTLDFWLRNDTSFGEKWQNASVLTIDFDDPNIVAAASALSGTLRVGGSPVNSIYFDTTGSCQPGGDGPSSPYYCSQVKPYIYACLTPQRWAEILRFAKKTGLKLLMGMNVCYGRKSANSSMDFSNMQVRLLRRFRSHGF
ncbi:Heparanase-like protein 3 [Diplonema papillatum]|nr:Heparanase-like protein 3 [Diplonema papillatum]